MSNLLDNLGHVKLNACYWILICAAVLTPGTWLGTPKDFWMSGIIAATTSMVAASLICVTLSKVQIYIVMIYNCLF